MLGTGDWVCATERGCVNVRVRVWVSVRVRVWVSVRVRVRLRLG